MILAGLGLSNVRAKERDRLDEVKEVAMSGEQEWMLVTGASQARSGQPHLTQVLRKIHMKRVVTLPQPEVRKRKKRL